MPFFDDTTISKRHKERIKAFEGEARENLTLAQRLTMRALKRTFTITLPGGVDGVAEEITLKFYVPAGDEWNRMHTLLMESVKCKLDTPEGDVRMKEIQDELWETLADLSLDESLTKEFWGSPKEWGADEFASVLVIKKIFEAVKRLAEDGGSFRSH